MMTVVVTILAMLVAVALSFSNSAPPQQASMTMMFSFGKKASSAPTPAGVKSKASAPPTTTGYQINEGTANKGSYIPDGLTKAQYDAFLKAEADKKASKAKKFPLGKQPLTLTEWMEDEAKKGFTGKGLLARHRLVKAKYPEFYTDENPAN